MMIDRRLALRELETIACLGSTVLLSLYHASIAGQKTSVTKRSDELFVVLDETPRYPKRDGLYLAVCATAVCVDEYVKLTLGFGSIERDQQSATPPLKWEILLGGLLVDNNFAGTGSQINSCDCCLAATYCGNGLGHK